MQFCVSSSYKYSPVWFILEAHTQGCSPHAQGKYQYKGIFSSSHFDISIEDLLALLSLLLCSYQSWAKWLRNWLETVGSCLLQIHIRIGYQSS